MTVRLSWQRNFLGASEFLLSFDRCEGLVPEEWVEDDDRCEQEFERDEEQALHDVVLVPEEWDDLEVPGLEPVT